MAVDGWRTLRAASRQLPIAPKPTVRSGSPFWWVSFWWVGTRRRERVARIAGVDIPRDKRVEISLRYIYGIGPSTAQQICAALGLSADEKIRDLTDDEVTKLREYIDGNLTVEGDLRRERQQAIKRLSEIGCYRGLRHRRGLPVRGQKTKTNARTRKGPKRMQVAGKKKATKK